MNIAIFGGSFDPPHIGHLAVIDEALRELPIETIFVVPAYINPFKNGTIASAKRRLEWLKIATSSYEKVSVCDFEVKAKKATHTIDTVNYLREKGDNIYLIIGADNLSAIDRWRDYKKLNSLVTWVIATRNKIELPKGSLTLKVNAPISSSELRESIKKEYLPKNIADEIMEFYG